MLHHWYTSLSTPPVSDGLDYGFHINAVVCFWYVCSVHDEIKYNKKASSLWLYCIIISSVNLKRVDELNQYVQLDYYAIMLYPTLNLSLETTRYGLIKLCKIIIEGKWRTFVEKSKKNQIQRGKACRSCIIESSKFSYIFCDWLLDRYRRMNNFHRFSINLIFFLCVLVAGVNEEREFQGFVCHTYSLVY